VKKVKHRRRWQADRTPPARAAVPPGNNSGADPISDIEAVAAKAHIDEHALERARADLGVITSRANTGGAHSVQWSPPG
jgi:hypothetical protein